MIQRKEKNMQEHKGFFMPAEWAEHERTLMEWPVREAMIYPENNEIVCEEYAAVAKTISEFEPVTMLVNANTAEQAKALCGDSIEYLTVPHNDAWCRDNGPTFLVDGEHHVSAVNWQFNAWGEKYLPCDLDNEVAQKVLEYYKVPFLNSPIVMEGGSIHVDGEGTLLTTRECLLNRNRNPHLTQKEIEDELKRCIGITKTIWLNHGLFGDETDGHVDNVACFARPGVVILQVCEDDRDPNYAITLENLEILRNTDDAKGRRIEVIKIPQPPARFYEGSRL
ncbi:MAG: agmatine deiminase, partial [Clostridiales bacterium 43-6]